MPAFGPGSDPGSYLKAVQNISFLWYSGWSTWFCYSNTCQDSMPPTVLSSYSPHCPAGIVCLLTRCILQAFPVPFSLAGFTGGVVVDFPNSAKAKKFYLCLFSGPSTFMPKTLNESNESNEEEEVQESVFTRERIPHRIACRRVVRKSREWVLEKEERRRQQGKEVRPDTQYTCRKRKPRF
ncbi:unnamed protein product [Nyctereutes procyonoides]|uniref:(raccoon dog) hypothetical protein n=1 Tax=Nyctereutes procyonoides TaxID=34880 RepID=A0A811YTR3_NYCPR|nr:unnamed protein product [Nyctereutes procyonoides]